MVVFTCQYCNANLKRKDIPVHKFKCQRNLWLTCIDCLKDFKNDEYEVHLQCITEAEKYGGKNYVPKETGKKQNSWMEAVRKVIQAGHKEQRLNDLFNKLKPYSNVPRNQKKFQNFARNSFGSQFSVEMFNRAYGLFMNEFSNNGKTQTNKRDDDSSGEKENGVKKNKRKNREDDGDDIMEEINGDTDVGQPKAKKGKRSLSTPADQSVTEGESAPLEMHVDDNGKALENEEAASEPKLTKKMKKQKKKMDKFQAEIQEIQNYKEPDEEIDDKPPKKKKKKNDVKVSEDTSAETTTGQSQQPEVAVQEDEAQPNKIGKFDWAAVIKEVLDQASGKEMSLKKLRKKVLSEYWRLNELDAAGTHETETNKVLARFNKKVGKTHGVKVLKDRAKLVE